MTATPPRADLRTLAFEAIWNDGMGPVMSPEDLADAVLAAVLPEHQRMVRRETLQTLLDRSDSFSLTMDGQTAAQWLPRLIGDDDKAAEVLGRLAAAAPPAGLSAPVPAENAPAVPEEADGQRAGQGAALNLYEVKVENEGDFRESLRQYDSRHLGHLVARRVSAVRALVAELRKTRAERDRLARELHEAQMMIERLTADDARDGTRRAWLELEHWRTVIVPELMEQRDRLGTDRDRLAAQVDRVRALHTALDGRCVECVEYCDCLDRVTELGDDVEVAASARMCNHGQEPWPCPTITAVDALPDAGTGQTEDHDAAH